MLQNVRSFEHSVCGNSKMMAKQGISEDLRKFLTEKVQTVLRLEVLLLLHDQHSRGLTAPEVARRLRFEHDATANALRELEAIGVVAQLNVNKTEYRYHPPNDRVRSLIEQLALDYPKHRVPILSAMLAEHPDRTRLFTEAFKIFRRND